VVDNERIFRDAVSREGYDTLFRDRFGGDFGHCTEKGNLLIAQNLARSLQDWYEKDDGAQKRGS
jgi:hypothetical protein